jgi:hypothetical protein
LHPAPRRSQRRLTPFFSSLLAFLFALATGPASLSAQEKPDPPPFLGETLRYAMTILGVAGGELTLSAGPAELQGRPAYKVEMSALSNNFLSNFFLVRDNIVSWIDPKPFRSLRFEKHTVEGKRVKDELTSSTTRMASPGMRENHRRSERRPWTACRPSTTCARSGWTGRNRSPPGLSVEPRVLQVEIQGRETIVVPAGTFPTIRVEPKSSGSGLMGKTSCSGSPTMRVRSPSRSDPN